MKHCNLKLMNYNAKWKEEQKRYNRHLNKILLNYDDLIAE